MEVIKNNFEQLLDRFNGLIKEQPPLKEVKDKLHEIKASALNAGGLTGRQLEAITERCDNYLNGTYGRNLSKPS